MYVSILFRMILSELTKVFLMSLFGITGILLMAGLIAEATQQGLGPAQILAAIPLLIPSMLPYTIPATTLFAACVVYGRLAADNEILAIKSAGVNLLRVVRPGLVLGLAMSAFTLGLYYYLIPHTHYLLRSMVFADAEEMMYALLRKNGMINHPDMAYSVFVKNVQGRNLVQTLFKKRSADGRMDMVAQARGADLHVNLAKQQIRVHMHEGVFALEDGSHAYFEDRDWEVPLADKWGPDAKKRPRALTWPEILERREEAEQELKKAQQEVAMIEAIVRWYRNPPQEYQAHVKNLINRQRVRELRVRELDVELLMRMALAASCFCFILVGCPIGIWFSRSDFLSSFITSFLPICIVYYPLMLCGTNMAKEGRFEPWALVWAANMCVGSVGLVLFTKLVRN